MSCGVESDMICAELYARGASCSSQHTERAVHSSQRPPESHQTNGSALAVRMKHGEAFDESRLVKPSDWDDGDDEGDLAHFEARKSEEFEKMKRQVASEKSEAAPAVPAAPAPAPAPIAPAPASTGSENAPLLHSRVEICELAAKPKLNGRLGTAISWDPDTARYGVQLDSTDASLGTICVAVKPANLRASSS